MTSLTAASQVFSRPLYQHQGPDSNCIINNIWLGWDSCTAYSGAMAVDSTTNGKKRPSGCAIRRATVPLDTTGGLMLRQVSDAITHLYGGAYMTPYTGANVLTPQRVAQLIRAGHKVVVQGNADAMLGTAFQSTAGAVNHAVMINEVRGGTVNEPHEALVYDPAADGRKRSYHVDQGPSWWPWSLVKTFVAHLRPAGGPSDPRLGPGKVYVGVFSDSEPHITIDSAHKGVKSKPFPDRTRAAKPTVWIHSAPRRGTPTRKYSVKQGTLLVGYQYVHGDLYQGSDLWLANDDANEFVHTKNLSHVGGTT